MIAIKGMDIPKGCIGCKIGDSVLNCPCKGSTLIFDYQDKRHPDCPLVEIVTCKDCKYNYENSCDFDGWGVDDNYFCAKGARKKHEKRNNS